MIDKRLIGTVPESRKYIAANVTLQWCGLAANVAMMISVASLLASLLTAPAATARLLTTAAVAAAAVLIRWQSYRKYLPEYSSPEADCPCRSY